jgi:hypothetical protein
MASRFPHFGLVHLNERLILTLGIGVFFIMINFKLLFSG